MGNIRITTGRRSRETGTTVGMQVNVFGLSKLEAGVTGEAMAPILIEALEIPLAEARSEWPVLTGASLDSMEIGIVEIGPRLARAVLQVGGPVLMADPRNKSHKDYAPYIEFNGSPTGRGQGAIANAIGSNDTEIRKTIREGVAGIIQGLVQA